MQNKNSSNCFIIDEKDLSVEYILDDFRGYINSLESDLDTKKKICEVLNSAPSNLICREIYEIIKKLSSEEFLKYKFELINIASNNILLNAVKKDFDNLEAAFDIALFDLQNKKKLNFNNLYEVSCILQKTSIESQNTIRIFINNIENDKECEILLPVLLSLIRCKKLVNDVSSQKKTVIQAIEDYKKIKSKIKNSNLSNNAINVALDLILKLQDDDLSEERLSNAIKLINLIISDKELQDLKSFIIYLSNIFDLPEVIIKNNFTISEIFRPAMKLHLLNAERLLKKNIKFKNLLIIIKFLEKCGYNQKKINIILDIVDMMKDENLFMNYIGAVFRIADDEKKIKNILDGHKTIEKAIDEFYKSYFSASKHNILEIIDARKFDFDSILDMDHLINSKSFALHRIMKAYLEKIDNSCEFLYCKKFLEDLRRVNNIDRIKDTITDAKNYYKNKLNVNDNDLDKKKVIDNINLNFDCIKNALNLFENNKYNKDELSKIAELISYMKSPEEYFIVINFIDELICNKDIFQNKKNLNNLTTFLVESLYSKADKLQVRKIFNNNNITLKNKSQSINYLENISDLDKRDNLANFICVIKDDIEFDYLKKYFNSISEIKNAHNRKLDYDDVADLCATSAYKILSVEEISEESAKKFSEYLKTDKENYPKEDLINLFSKLNKDEEFELFFKNIKKIISNTKILGLLLKKEIKTKSAFFLLKNDLENILFNSEISSELKNNLLDFESYIDENKRKEVHKLLSQIKNDQEFNAIKYYLINIDLDQLKTDSDVFESTKKFYIDNLTKNNKVSSDVKVLISDLIDKRKYSYEILKKMFNKINSYHSFEDRKEISAVISLAADDAEYIKYEDQIFPRKKKKDPSEDSDKNKSSAFSKKMLNAKKVAEKDSLQQADNYQNSEETEYQNQNTKISVFNDDEIKIDVIGESTFIEIKSLKILLTTMEFMLDVNDEFKEKLRHEAKNINENIKKNFYLFRDSDDCINKFSKWLTENDEAESDADIMLNNGFNYFCLAVDTDLDDLNDLFDRFIEHIAKVNSGENDIESDTDADDEESSDTVFDFYKDSEINTPSYYDNYSSNEKESNDTFDDGDDKNNNEDNDDNDADKDKKDNIDKKDKNE
ncbi:MAG: hypothetical protein LBJ93_02780 [Clostridiales bacterium]|jgi:hypothetical protein|nr:hypothetical protein [Clostridiales bacterium]